MSDRLLRRLFPSLPPLTRNRVVMFPLDVLDRVLNSPWPELRGLPPNRMRLRVGVQNRLLFNGFAFRSTAVHFWMTLLARRHARLDSRIIDLGSGCGRFAMPLRDLNLWGRGFKGHYVGVDIDAEMLAWCARNFDSRFAWHDAGRASATYRPARSDSQLPPPAPSQSLAATPPARGGGGASPSATQVDAGALALPTPDASRDLAFANSLFSHLLEADFIEYVREVARALRPGGWFYFTAFIREHVNAGGRLGGRWTFAHQRGQAWIETQRYPEAAVAYDEAWVRQTLTDAGFTAIHITPAPAQSLVRCRKSRPRA